MKIRYASVDYELAEELSCGVGLNIQLLGAGDSNSAIYTIYEI